MHSSLLKLIFIRRYSFLSGILKVTGLQIRAVYSPPYKIPIFSAAYDAHGSGAFKRAVFRCAKVSCPLRVCDETLRRVQISCNAVESAAGIYATMGQQSRLAEWERAAFSREH